MLKAVGLVLAAFAAVALMGIAWLYYRAVAGGRRAYAALAERVQPVAQALAAGEDPSPTHLMRFAESRETRKVLYELLASFHKTALFPAKYLTWELMAEADLVAWLCHPNELGGPPSEIELVARVPEPGAPSNESMYFVFRYRTSEPHWAAKDGWLAGVAGPYATASAPTPHANGTFSRFEAIGSRTPEDHVAVVHAAVFGERRAPLERAS
jgi:hypothetical protein